MLLALRTEPRLVALSVVVKVVEHEVEVVIDLLGQMVDHLLLPVDNYLDVSFAAIFCISTLLGVHVVAERSGLREVRGALRLLYLAQMLLILLLRHLRAANFGAELVIAILPETCYIALRIAPGHCLSLLLLDGGRA